MNLHVNLKLYEFFGDFSWPSLNPSYSGLEAEALMNESTEKNPKSFSESFTNELNQKLKIQFMQMKEKWISRSTSFEFLMQICSENYLSWFRNFIPTIQINFVMSFAWKNTIQISLVNPIYFRLGIKFSFSLFCMNKYCYIIYLLFLNRVWKNKSFTGKYGNEKASFSIKLITSF
jgi:hypothetical protein